jgi:hypothetical protein
VGLRIEGYDPKTGDTTWSVPLSPAAAAAQAREVYQGDVVPEDGVVVGQKVGWLPARSGGRAVAWSDGSQLALRPSSVLLCQGPDRFAYATDADLWPIRDTDTYAPCTPGRPHAPARKPSAAGLAIAATPAGTGRYLVAYADRLVAYRVV